MSSPSCLVAVVTTLHHSEAQRLHVQNADPVINNSEPAIFSLLLCFCLSVSVLPRHSVMIHNHHSVRLHQHPSLFMEFHSQGCRGKKSRERKRQPSSQGQREGYSALYFQMTSQREEMSPCPHVFSCQSLTSARHLWLSVCSVLLAGSLHMNKMGFHHCRVPNICEI